MIWCGVHTQWSHAGEGDVAERSTTGGGHRWPPAVGNEITERSRIKLSLCLKLTCGKHYKTCYCCMVLPDMPCYFKHQRCLDICPPGAQAQQQPLPAAPRAALSPGDFYWLYRDFNRTCKFQELLDKGFRFSVWVPYWSILINFQSFTSLAKH